MLSNPKPNLLQKIQSHGFFTKSKLKNPFKRFKTQLFPLKFIKYPNTIRLMCRKCSPEFGANESLLCSNMEPNINFFSNIVIAREERRNLQTLEPGKGKWVKDYGFMLHSKTLSSCFLPFNFVSSIPLKMLPAIKTNESFAAVYDSNCQLHKQ